MKDETWIKRMFLLSSFSRLGIIKNNEVRWFIDKVINEQWVYPSDLTELDRFIHEEYRKFKNG